MNLAADAGVRGVVAPTIAVNDTDLYFALGDQNSGIVMAVPIRGGRATAIAAIVGGTGWAPNSNLVLTPARVAFVQGTSETAQIVSAPLDGGAVTLLATTRVFPSVLATDGQNVFFPDQDGIKSVAVTGGPVQTLTTEIVGSLWADELVVEGSDLLIGASGPGDAGSLETIYQLEKTGGAVSLIGTGQWGVAHPVACGQDVCWWSSDGPPPASGLRGPSITGSIVRASRSGVSASVAQGIEYPVNLLFDGTNFFASVEGDSLLAHVIGIPPDGSAPTVFPMEGVLYIALDDTCLYASSPNGIYSVAKTLAKK